MVDRGVTVALAIFPRVRALRSLTRLVGLTFLVVKANRRQALGGDRERAVAQQALQFARC